MLQLQGDCTPQPPQEGLGFEQTASEFDLCILQNGPVASSGNGLQLRNVDEAPGVDPGDTREIISVGWSE